jgi:hypothetical protein
MLLLLLVCCYLLERTNPSQLVYPTVQEAIGAQAAEQSRVVHTYRPPEVGNAEQISANDKPTINVKKLTNSHPIKLVKEKKCGLEEGLWLGRRWRVGARHSLTGQKKQNSQHRILA